MTPSSGEVQLKLYQMMLLSPQMQHLNVKQKSIAEHCMLYISSSHKAALGKTRDHAVEY